MFDSIGLTLHFLESYDTVNFLYKLVAIKRVAVSMLKPHHSALLHTPRLLSVSKKFVN